LGVFVLDKRKKPLMPCTEKRARQLLEKRRAVVHRLQPFTIRLKDRSGGETQPLRLKLDPGSRTTGVAIVREQGDEQHVLHLDEITHRGATIKASLDSRRALRRSRRSRKTRYRKPRFLNRRRRNGWLPPSLESRIGNVLTWVERLRRLCPITALSQELVKFDAQAIENPEISGVEYQQGTRAGYEVREYLLEKWGRQCAYCGKTDVPLQVEHIDPKSRGGTNRVSNLALACQPCNDAKANRPVAEFLKHKPDVLQRILAQAKAPMKDTTAVNATRWELFRRLQATGLPVETGSGGRTKWNRSRLGIPKTHALDAACVGSVGSLSGSNRPVLSIGAKGRGSYSRTRYTAHGFPRGYLMREKSLHGFQTGDMVRADIPSGKKAGIHRGRVAVRASGCFNIQTAAGVVQGISWRYCTVLWRGDGYSYVQCAPVPPQG
jgi:5-methylcytosine-specific restriction endonuclease McrA